MIELLLVAAGSILLVAFATTSALGLCALLTAERIVREARLRGITASSLVLGHVASRPGDRVPSLGDGDPDTGMDTAAF